MTRDGGQARSIQPPPNNDHPSIVLERSDDNDHLVQPNIDSTPLRSVSSAKCFEGDQNSKRRCCLEQDEVV
eukprot:CAMPEP_0196134792 /NCGR_PEP_ID=MMETSP0910-20130528/3620_1 /TAXON_ID=49265 /ORGANISM="Thalassiosira rotula, Strain GSO102" /LENGTH=70 /DNA_ID=CAMNT_0041394817 /DNA_START=89 /DNA_END=301 /DNA_ORIENTATION=+